MGSISRVLFVAALLSVPAVAFGQGPSSPNTIAGPAHLFLKPGQSAIIYQLKVSRQVDERRIITFEYNNSDFTVVVQHVRKDKVLHASEPIKQASSSVEFEVQNNDSIRVMCEGQAKGDTTAAITWRVDAAPAKK